MTRSIFGALTTLVLALAVNAAFAQSRVKAKVPFAFAVDESSMPAGQYTIAELSDRILQISNDETGATVSIVTLREESVNQQTPRLVFHRYGDQYVLAEAWGSWKDSGMELPTSKLEKEIRAAYHNTSPHGEEVVVALR